MIIKNVVIVGHVRSGKGSIARHLSKFMSYRFYCLERYIENNIGASTEWIKEMEGADGLQGRGTHLLTELLQRDHIVIAICNDINISRTFHSEFMKNSYVVYVGSRDKTKVTRYVLNRTEDTRSSLDKINEFFTHKAELYISMADICVDPYQHSIKDSVKKITDDLALNHDTI